MIKQTRKAYVSQASLKQEAEVARILAQSPDLVPAIFDDFKRARRTCASQPFFDTSGPFCLSLDWDCWTLESCFGSCKTMKYDSSGESEDREGQDEYRQALAGYQRRRVPVAPYLSAAAGHVWRIDMPAVNRVLRGKLEVHSHVIMLHRDCMAPLVPAPLNRWRFPGSAVQIAEHYVLPVLNIKKLLNAPRPPRGLAPAAYLTSYMYWAVKEREKKEIFNYPDNSLPLIRTRDFLEPQSYTMTIEECVSWYATKPHECKDVP
ncbi:hypothetical protein GGX14DRAFT_393369 [Mycena pura]|uniref:Uncharacterized protein n=1 Tax=Mycena pura TaxID=153505 RepID=A0AAD6VLQ0_9AGAR|nr:hypothetical protein GGX14DRAFT_393369 [Mycena pura]